MATERPQRDASATQIAIRRDTLTSPVAAKLIHTLNAELSARYPEEGANHFSLDPQEVEPGQGAFLIAYVRSEAVGCGAVRLIDGSTAEIKRMYVEPHARRLGLGRRMLAALEAEARRLGATRLVLETGDRYPDALNLYLEAGFVRVAAFGEYVASPLSVCMAKVLEVESSHHGTGGPRD